MEYQVNFGCWGHVFAVPTAVVDHFIRLASASQLKVLLYLLRSGGQIQQTEQLASALGITAEQADEALEFWVQANILQLPEAPAAPRQFDFMQVPPPSPAPAEPPAPSAKVQRSSRDIKLDPSEIAHSLEGSQELKDLFTCAESLFGRMLTHMEQRSLLWMHSYLGMRSEVLLTLLGYCVSIDKVSMSYAESIAIAWVDAEILTLQQAEAEIQRLTEIHSFNARIQKIFCMHRKPTSQQQKYIDDWKAAGYAMELIEYAYELTIESIDKLNFKYINTILEKWAATNITTAEQARMSRQSYAKQQKDRGTQGMTEREIEEMNDYLSLVNRFRKE